MTGQSKLNSVSSTLNAIPFGLKVAGAAGGAILAIVFQMMRARSRNNAQPRGEGAIEAVDSSKGKKSTRVAVDMVFFRRMKRLLKILVPSFFTPEVGYISLVAVMMIARTYCDLWVLANGTATERAIITRDPVAFKHHFIRRLLAMIPISVVNNVLKYGLWELALRFRARLTRHLYRSYLKGFTYYQLANLDNRIENADQLLTQDVDKFCQSVAGLYSNMSKPLLDIFIYARALTSTIGFQGPFNMLGYLILSGVFLTRLRRPTGRFTVQEQHLEGDFRFVNSRLITNSEEIAFYRGNGKEREIIDGSFNRLVNLLRRSMQFRGVIGFIDTIIAKYCATAVGFLVLSRPFLSSSPSQFDDMAQDAVMEEYYKNGRMLINMATAMGRLVLAGRELTRLAGFTARVTELMDVLEDLNQGKYQRTMVQQVVQKKSSTDFINKSDEEKEKEGESLPDGIEANSDSDSQDDEELVGPLVPNSGKIVYQDRLIKFDRVPLVTPNGDVLVRSLSFEVRSGVNVLVCGPNGCGKSSLFRILGELWPLFGGTLTKPAANNLFYVPQRPYLTLGTLRDQVIYPQTSREFAALDLGDEHLLELLKLVRLDYLAEREGGWDSVQDWADVLSGGEKQRVAMARLFYHKPQFAILDECTSAVSVDVEGFMYTHCRNVLNITLFTVSHRKSLWKYHDYVLQFDGRGDYQYVPRDEANEFGS